MEKIVVFTDGGSRGNPGEAAIGVYIETLNKEYGECIGIKTNNDAEYGAIVFAIRKVRTLIGKEKAKKVHLDLYMDSELAVRQLNHIYKIKEERIQKMFMEIWNDRLDFGKVTFTHVQREQNKRADAMVNIALDGQVRQESLL